MKTEKSNNEFTKGYVALDWAIWAIQNVGKHSLQNGRIVEEQY